MDANILELLYSKPPAPGVDRLMERARQCHYQVIELKAEVVRLGSRRPADAQALSEFADGALDRAREKLRVKEQEFERIQLELKNVGQTIAIRRPIY